MSHHRIKSITGAMLYLTFLSKKSRDKSKIALDFVRHNVKIIDTDELYRLSNILRKEEQQLPDFTQTQINLDYDNAIKCLNNEASKRRRNHDLY